VPNYPTHNADLAAESGGKLWLCVLRISMYADLSSTISLGRLCVIMGPFVLSTVNSEN
jgi:hypothetical protein